MIEFKKYEPKYFYELCLLSDDEWKENIYIIANSLKVSDSTIENCWLAFDNQKIIGFVYGFILPNRTLLPEFLYVTPEYRNNGIGVALMKKLEEESGCTASMIFYNTALHDYYQKQNYLSGDNLEVAIKTLKG